MSTLSSVMETTLRRQPNLTARELMREVRRLGGVAPDTHKRNLNQVLYREPLFVHDGGRVPRWRLPGQGVPRPDRASQGVRVRARRADLDAAAALMAQRSSLYVPRHRVAPAPVRISWG